MFEYLLKLPGSNTAIPKGRCGYVMLLYSVTPALRGDRYLYKRYFFDCEGKWIPRAGDFSWAPGYVNLGNRIWDLRSINAILKGCCPPQLSSVILELGGMSG